MYRMTCFLMIALLSGIFCVSFSQTSSQAIVSHTVLMKLPDRNTLNASVTLADGRIAAIRSAKPLCGELFYDRPDLVELLKPSGIFDWYLVESQANAEELHDSGYQVEENQPVFLNALRLPNDTLFTQQWALQNDEGPDTAALEGWKLRARLTPALHSVKIGIVDTGIDYKHEDLRQSMWVNPKEIADNDIDDDHNGIVDDVYGVNAVFADQPRGDPYDDYLHGTHVAGIIAARSNNHRGISGLFGKWTAPDQTLVRPQLVAGKFLDAGGSGDVAGAVYVVLYMLAHDVKVMNHSWGANKDSQLLRDVVNATERAGAIWIVAAGNNVSDIGIRPLYPASYAYNPITRTGSKHVLAVAALSQDGTLADFSNYGVQVQCAAPGDSIVSTFPKDYYGYLSGTSMATPYTAAVAAILYALEHPSDASGIIQRIIDGSQPLDSLKRTVLGAGSLHLYNTLINDTSIPRRIRNPTLLNATQNTLTFSYEIADASTYRVVARLGGKKGAPLLGVPPPTVGVNQVVVRDLEPGQTYTIALIPRNRSGRSGPIVTISGMTLP